MIVVKNWSCIRQRLLSFPPVRCMHTTPSPCRQLLSPGFKKMQQPNRTLYRLVEFYQKKKRDIWEEPLRVVYAKDGVSRARNILVYKSSRNIVIPVIGVLTIIMLCVEVQTIYNVYYLEVQKEDPDYDEYEYRERYLTIPLFGGFLFVVMVINILSRYVIRIYYNEPKKLFTITTFNILMPWVTTSRVVRAGTGRLKMPVTAPVRGGGDDDQFNANILYNCTIDGRKHLLYPEFFKYPVYFNVLFGYEDPDAIARLNDSNENADKIFRDRAEDKHDY